MSDILTDESWMRYAIRLAQRAETAGEVPVGAVLIKNETVLAEGWNAVIETHDSSAHAEIAAIRRAGKVLENYRLIDTTLYVTLEPCVMCMGAISHARVKRLVFGAFDEKRGAVCNALTCSQLLKDFFATRRKNSTRS